jgi:hypothetical protein
VSAALELIRTTLKEKLPNGFSYPVGAEIISNALRGVPQFALASIHFSWKDTFWASEYNERLKALGKIRVFEVGFNQWRNWYISVHAVPSPHKQLAATQLSSDLPKLALELFQTAIEPQDFHWEAQYDLAAHPNGS